MADTAFTWGSGGEKLSSADRRRRIAEAMMQRGTDTSPVQHWTQGAARVAQALLGAWDARKLDDEEKTERSAQAQRNNLLLGGGASPGAGSASVSNAATPPAVDIGTPNDVENSFVKGVREAGLTNPIGLGAVAAYGNAESRYSPANVNRTWSDPSERGAAGTSGGIMSWRDDRLRNLIQFAAGRGEQGNGSPATQAAFLAQEDATLIPRLNAAKSPEEANQIMAAAWRFAGHDRPGGEFARRLALTQQYAQRFGQPQTAAADLPAPGANPVAEDTGAPGFFIPPGGGAGGIMQPGGALPNYDQDTGRWLGPSNPPVSSSTGSPEELVNQARSYLASDALTVTDISRAFRAKTNIDQMIADAAEKGRSGVADALKPIREALDDKLAKSSPQYAAARDAYRVDSQPSQDQPLTPAFNAEGVSQPWMNSAIMPAPPEPQMAQATPVPLPPPRPANLAMPQADLPVAGAVPAMGQLPQAVYPEVDPNSPDAGMRQLQVASEEMRLGLPSGASIMSPLDGLRQAFGNGAGTPSGGRASAFDRIVAALSGPQAQAAAQPATSPAVQRVAASMPAGAMPAAEPSPAVQRVASAMGAVSSPRDQVAGRWTDMTLADGSVAQRNSITGEVRVAQSASGAGVTAPTAPANARLQAAYATLNSPYAKAGEKAVAQMVVQQAIKGGEFETITRPDGSVFHVPKTGGAPVQVFGPQAKPEGPTGDMREYALYTDQEKAAGRQPESFTDWSRGNKAAGRTSINIDTKGAGKFAEKANELQAKRYGEMVDSSDGARQMQGDLDMLDEMMKGIGTGRGAEMRLGMAQFAKAWGFDDIASGLTGGKLGEMEAFTSLIDKLTPQMRQGMPGAASDRDVAIFRNALPNMLKTPEGNQIVMQTLRSMNDYKMRAGDLAGQALRGEISQADADKGIRALTSPFARFKEFRSAQSSATTPGAGQQAQPVPEARKVVGGKAYVKRGSEWFEE